MLRVTVEDLETGDKDERMVQDGDYLIVVHDPCYLHQAQAYPKSGTHVVTLKGVLPGARPAPDPAQPAGGEGP